MKRRDVEKALKGIDAAVLREGGEHTIWICNCGQHKTALPRHSEITAGVVGSIGKQIACAPKGWLQ